MEKRPISKLFRKFYPKFKGYTPGEQPRGSGWIKLNTNENPYEPPPAVIEDLKNGLKDLRKYPDIDAVEVKKQLTYNIRPSRTVSLKMDNVVVGSGEDELLDIIFKTFVDPNDRVVYFTPTYGMYKVLCNIHDAVPIEIPRYKDFKIPEDKALSTQGELMLICSPNNPDGGRTPNELISKICDSFDGIVVVDEAYVDFAENTALSLLLDHENLIILRTFSKSYSLAALRVGFLLSLNRDIIVATRKVKLPYNVNLAGQVAALSALKHQKEIDETIEIIKSEREKLISAINELPEVEALPSESNFILMRVNVGDQSKNMKVNQKIFWELKKKKILVRSRTRLV
ncbi:MAG: histidinol-phosphate transaminase [Promethearchaeota archaeon]